MEVSSRFKDLDGPVLDWLRIIRRQTVSEDGCDLPRSLLVRRRCADPRAVNRPISSSESVRDLILVRLLLDPHLLGRDDDMTNTWLQSLCSCFQPKSSIQKKEEDDHRLVVSSSNRSLISQEQDSSSGPSHFADIEDDVNLVQHQQQLVLEEEEAESSSAQEEPERLVESLATESPETCAVAPPSEPGCCCCCFLSESQRLGQNAEDDGKIQGGQVTKRRQRPLPPPPFSLSRISEVSCELTPPANDLKFAQEISVSVFFSDDFQWLVSRHLPSPVQTNSRRRYSCCPSFSDFDGQIVVGGRHRYSWPVCSFNNKETGGGGGGGEFQQVAHILFHSSGRATPERQKQLSCADVCQTPSWTDAVVWQTTSVQHLVHHARIAYASTQVSLTS